MTIAPLPEHRATLQRLDVDALWRLRPNLDLRLNWRLERFASRDWGRDDVGPNTLANVILHGEETSDYRSQALAYYRLR